MMRSARRCDGISKHSPRTLYWAGVDGQQIVALLRTFRCVDLQGGGCRVQGHHPAGRHHELPEVADTGAAGRDFHRKKIDISRNRAGSPAYHKLL
jgi:hypothetical protein